jgi:hypothetical protein
MPSAEQPLAKPVRNWFSVLVPRLVVVLDSAPSAVPASGPLGIDVQDSHYGPHLPPSVPQPWPSYSGAMIMSPAKAFLTPELAFPTRDLVYTVFRRQRK